MITVAAGAVLNFEGTNVFNLTVSATDGVTTPATAPVTISLTNVNESPTFNQASYSFSLPENSVQGTSVGTVAATDPDAGTTLVYSLSGTGSTNFSINSATGAITVAAGAVLNFEGTNTFNLSVGASDGSITTTAPLTISLTNVKEARISIPTNLTTAVDVDTSMPGVQVDIPLRLDVIEGAGLTVAGVDFVMLYDSTKITVDSVRAGGLLSGANLRGAAFGGATNLTAGRVAISQSSNDGTVTFPVGTSGDLYLIRATVVTNATGSTKLNLQATNTAIYDNNIDTLSLIPAPTNADTDSVDGSLTISVATVGTKVSGNLSFNGGVTQRSTVKELTINFDAPVTVASDAFLIERRANAALGITAGTINYIVTVVSPTQVRLTFTGAGIIGGSLPDGQYDLTIIASKVLSGGVALDGDGDGVAGGDFRSRATDNFFRLFGDTNGDAVVDSTDLAAVGPSLFKLQGDAAFNPALDWDGDGDVDATDYRQFKLRFGRRFN